MEVEEGEVLKREATQLIVVIVSVIACTVVMTDRAQDDWRYAGTVVLAYVALVGLHWLVWGRRQSARRNP